MANYEKPDFWSQKAQKEDYPARSVYKLREIDEKFGLFAAKTPALRVLDLGAAPGSWSLYVLRTYGIAGKSPLFLAAADLLPLSRHFAHGKDGFFFIQGDFTAIPVREALAGRGPYNVVMSDAAPPTTGKRTVDTMRSLSLAEDVLSLAESCLVPGGNMAVKVFQGGETAEVLTRMKSRFDSVKSFKPSVCRSNSFETYYIGLGKKL